MSKYLLLEDFLGGTCLEIDQELFERLMTANTVIKKLWDAEDSFSLLANSFIEFEEYLLKVGLEYYFQRELQRNTEEYFEVVRQTLNLKLIAVLTSSRAYEEQLHRRSSELSKIIGKPLDLRQSFSHAYDKNLEYRVMYALRNDSLHNQLPIKNISFNGSNLWSSGTPGDGSPSRHRVTIEPKITVADFCRSDKIKVSVRDEVKNLGYKHLSLKYFARGFLACLSKCQHDFREHTEVELEGALHILENANTMLKEAKGESPRFVSIHKLSDDQETQKHYIDYIHKSRLRELRKFWSGLRWNQGGYVSSEIVAAKDTFPEKHKDLWIPK